MAKFRSPQALADVSVFIDGIGFLGTVAKDGVKFPEVEILRESFTAGGFERDYETGVFKKLEFEITIQEINPVIWTAVSLGLASGLGINMVIKASAIQDGERKPIVVVIQGSPTVSIEEAKTTLKGTAWFYSYTFDGIPLCILDTKNMIGMIGGVDYLATLRSHIM